MYVIYGCTVVQLYFLYDRSYSAHIIHNSISRTTKRQPRPSILILVPSSEAALVGVYREIIVQGRAVGVVVCVGTLMSLQECM